MQLIKILGLALASLVVATPVDLEKKEPIRCTTETSRQTEKVGNGNPHQNFIFKQVSGTTDCTNNPSGSATVTHSYTVGWSVSAGFAGDYINGGFSVSESTSTGYTNSFGCKTNSGTHTGSLCVFERIQVTAFTAQTRECTESSCGGTSCGSWSTGVIFAPNSNQGSCFYDNFQLGLSCEGVNTEHQVNSGPAGGPQYVACEPSQA